MAKKWYVIQTYSGFENKVKAALQERVAASRRRSASRFVESMRLRYEGVAEKRPA